MTSKEKCENNHDFIVANFKAKTAVEMAVLVGVSQTAYRSYCYDNSLKKQKHLPWKAHEVEYLKANFKSKGDVEIGEALGRKCKSIEKKRFYLKLNRTKSQTTKIKKRNVSVRNAGYQKGRISEMANRRTNGEVFKWKDDRYWRIKTKFGIYFLHRYIWIWNFGEVDKSESVVFKDGDANNCTLENLALMKKYEVSIYNRRKNSAANLEAMKMAFTERIYSGLIPYNTPKGTVYFINKK